MTVDAHVLISSIRGPHSDETKAIGGVLHIDARIPVLRPDIEGIARRGVPGTVRAIVHRIQVFVIDVQGAQMGGIDVALDTLEPVAVHGDTRGHHMVRRELVKYKIRQWGLLLWRTHVGPEYPGGLDDGVSLSTDLVFEIASRCVRRCGDALAMDVEGKAM